MVVCIFLPLQSEIRNLRKQLSQFVHKSTGSASAKTMGVSAKTTAAQASLAAALTSGVATTT